MTQNARTTLFVIIGILAGMLTLAFYSPVLYNTFCKVTGFGGTTQIATNISLEGWFRLLDSESQAIRRIATSMAPHGIMSVLAHSDAGWGWPVASESPRVACLTDVVFSTE